MAEAKIETVNLGGTFREWFSLEETWKNWTGVIVAAESSLGKLGSADLDNTTLMQDSIALAPTRMKGLVFPGSVPLKGFARTFLLPQFVYS